MKKIICISFFLLFLSHLHCDKAANGPVIQFDNPTYDCGVLKETEATATHEFRFKNIGNEALRVVEVRTSCGCTVLSPPTIEIMPGETGIIPFEAQFRIQEGPQELTALVVTNEQKPTKLTMRGEVHPELILSVAELDAGRLLLGKAKEVDFEIRVPRIVEQESLEPLSLTTSSLSITTRIKERRVVHNAMGEALILNCTARIVGTSVGKMDEAITVTRKLLNNSRRLPISVEVVGNITSHPERVFLGVIPTQTTISKTILIESGPNITLKEARADTDALAAEIRPRKEGQNELRVLTVPQNLKPGALKGQITVISDDTAQPSLIIPVSGLVESEESSQSSPEP